MNPLDGFGISYTSVSLWQIRSMKLSMTAIPPCRRPSINVRNLFNDLRKQIFEILNPSFIVAPATLRRPLQRRFDDSTKLTLPLSLLSRA